MQLEASATCGPAPGTCRTLPGCAPSSGSESCSMKVTVPKIALVAGPLLRDAGWGGGSCGWLSPEPRCSASPPSWPGLHRMPIPLPPGLWGETQRSSRGDRERAPNTHTPRVHTHAGTRTRCPTFLPQGNQTHLTTCHCPVPPGEGNPVALRSLNTAPG